MKKFLLGLLFLISLNIAAVEVQVDDAYCGELDPFIVGDACLVFVTTPANSKIAVLFDFDDLEMMLGEAAESLTGKNISLDFDLIEKIQDGQVISLLKEFGSEYFYMEGSIEAIDITK